MVTKVPGAALRPSVLLCLNEEALAWAADGGASSWGLAWPGCAPAERNRHRLSGPLPEQVKIPQGFRSGIMH